ncbi:hypothetical protein EG68_11944 [Paragonimus skrjabini miyazakii]|uniref:Uncharacterized protein n=1 Tax=Paragonimus skrjabini miyazakii TaxID=59628 RepID=A0A8S9YH61_9TREM|nr:hypothetical protein EG68_11944 [Paragonimus skrjabini miyazakii]
MPVRPNAVSVVPALRSTRRERARNGYSADELTALRNVIFRARDLLKHNDQLSNLWDKSIWMQIANHMHAVGWPKRPWTRLRTKGQHMLISSGVTDHLNSTPLSRGHMVECSLSSVTTPSCISATVPCLIQNSITQSVCNVGSRPTADSGLISMIRGSSELHCQPPPLVPSSVASANVLRSLANATIDVNSEAVHGAAVPSGPQIVHVCSKASTKETAVRNGQFGRNVDVSNTSASELIGGLNPLDRTSVLDRQSCTHTPTFTNAIESCRIDLSVSSDEEGDVDHVKSVPSAIHQCIPPTPCSTSPQAPPKHKPPNLTRAELLTRMQVYQKKLESLSKLEPYLLTCLAPTPVQKTYTENVCSNPTYLLPEKRQLPSIVGVSGQPENTTTGLSSLVDA